jgi:hypothetical protein
MMSTTPEGHRTSNRDAATAAPRPKCAVNSLCDA